MVKSGYKLTEINEIPEEWGVVKLGEIAEIHDNKRIPLSEEERKNIKGEYPYCGASGIIDYINKYIFDGEYVLLAEDGGYWGKFENSSYLMSGKFWVNNHAHIIRAINGMTTNLFLLYYLNFADLTRYITGSTRGKMNQGQLKSITCPIPPLPEQKKITSILSTVDDAIQNTNDVIEKTQKLKKGLMQQLLTKGIGHTRFKQTEIGEIPEEWGVVKLREVTERFISGGTPSTSKPEYWTGKIPWMRSAHIEGRFVDSGEKYISEEGLDNSATNVVPEGNILVATRVCIGNIAINKISVAISQDLTGVVVNKNKANPEYLYWGLLNSENIIKAWIQGSTIKGVLRNDLQNLKLPLPPPPEQQKIAEILSGVDEKIDVERKRKEKLVRLKKGLMQDLLTGKVRVKI